MKVIDENTKIYKNKYSRAMVRDGNVVSIQLEWGQGPMVLYFERLSQFGEFLLDANEMHARLKQEGV